MRQRGHQQCPGSIHRGESVARRGAHAQHASRHPSSPSHAGSAVLQMRGPRRTPPAAPLPARAAPALRSLVRDDDASLRQSQQPDAVVTGVSCSSATVPRAPTDVSPHGGSRASILDVGATTAGRQGRLHYRRQSRAVSVLRCVDAAAPSHMVGGRQLRVLARCCLRCFPHLTLTSFAAWVHAGSSRLSDIQG